MIPANINTEPSNIPPPAEYFGRTTREWCCFLSYLPVVGLVAIGATHIHDCDFIPALPIYLIVLGALHVAIGLVRIVFRVEPNQSAESLAVPSSVRIAGKRIYQLLSFASLGVIIWGAVLTFSKVGEYREGGDGAECPGSVFYTGFVITVVLLTFTVFFVVCAVCVTPAVLGIFFLYKRKRGERDDTELDGGVPADEESKA